MATSPELERADSSLADAAEVRSPRLPYLVGGAVVGAAYGLLVLGMESGRNHISYPLAVPAVMLLGGALVGFVLHATRSWSRRGKWRTLGRWMLAFLSSWAAMGIALLIFRGITFVEYFGILAFAGMAGAGFGVEAAHHEWQDTASEKALSRHHRMMAVLLILCIGGLIYTFTL